MISDDLARVCQKTDRRWLEAQKNFRPRSLSRCTELSTFVHPCNEKDGWRDFPINHSGIKTMPRLKLFSPANSQTFGHIRCSYSCRRCRMLKYPIERPCPRCSCKFMIVFLDISPWMHSIRGYCRNRNCDHSIDWKLIHKKTSPADQELRELSSRSTLRVALAEFSARCPSYD
jgi:hypothetical protein